jgi:hypothetical protein
MSLNKPFARTNLMTALFVLPTLASGCATAGLIYEDVGHPPIHVGGGSDSRGLAWDGNLNASIGGRELAKRGVACSQDILKLVAWGDGTQAAAARQGGITEIVGLDFENTAILGFFYTKSCTVVYGNSAPSTPPVSAAPAVSGQVPVPAGAPELSTDAPPATTAAPTAMPSGSPSADLPTAGPEPAGNAEPAVQQPAQ